MNKSSCLLTEIYNKVNEKKVDSNEVISNAKKGKKSKVGDYTIIRGKDYPAWLKDQKSAYREFDFDVPKSSEGKKYMFLAINDDFFWEGFKSEGELETWIKNDKWK